MRTSLAALLLLILGILVGCASTDTPEEVLPEKTYYEQASKAMNSGNFTEATANLEALETYYPFGRFAEQAQLDLIYARYQNIDLEGARIAADRYLRLHPQSQHADYALYMRGIASYYLDIGLAARFLPIDSSGRDPGEQRQAIRDFMRLLDKYPQSQYAADARQRVIAIRNRLARLELEAAQYYIKREAYLAAANRARHVLENYPRSPALEDALILMVELYRILQMPKASEDMLALLKLNFPETAALDGEGRFVARNIRPQDRSLLSVMTFGLLGGAE